MTRSESIRHNARLIRQHVRGKSQAERKAIYDMISAGPLGLMLQVITAITSARKPVSINVNSPTTSGDAHIRALVQQGVSEALKNARR